MFVFALKPYTVQSADVDSEIDDVIAIGQTEKEKAEDELVRTKHGKKSEKSNWKYNKGAVIFSFNIVSTLPFVNICVFILHKLT